MRQVEGPRHLIRLQGREQTLLSLIPGMLEKNPLDLLGTTVAATEVLQARDPEVTATAQRQPESAAAEPDACEPVRPGAKLAAQRPEVGSGAGSTENDAKSLRPKDDFRSATAVLEDRANAELAKRRHRDGRAPEGTPGISLVYIANSDLDEGLNVLRIARKNAGVPADNPTATETTQLRESAGVAQRANASRLQNARSSSQLSRLYFSRSRNYSRFRQPPPMSAASDAL